MIAEGEATVVVEGNHYFPPDSVYREYLRDSDKQSTCLWKGKSELLRHCGRRSGDSGAGWYYPDPKPAASEIKDHVASWKGVQGIP